MKTSGDEDYRLIQVDEETAETYTQAAAEMLNDEWPGGGDVKSRKRGLLPDSAKDSVSHLLINGQSEVLAHARTQAAVEVGQVQIVLNYKEGVAAALLSVVTKRNLRGSGVGRVLMRLVEQYVKSRGYCMLYLWTSTAEGFYAKCGYSECEKVNLSQSVFKVVDDAAIQTLEKALENKLAKMLMG